MEHANGNRLAERWWLLVVRGMAAILFGACVFLSPRISLPALALLFGAYALADGALNLGLAWRRVRAGRRWGWLLGEGVVSLSAAAVAFLWRGIPSLALLVTMAVRAALAGVAQIGAATRLRRYVRGEWLLRLSGAFSLAFGLFLLLVPVAGVFAVLALIGMQSVVFGALLCALGLRLRGRRRATARMLTAGPASTLPTPA